MTGQMTQNHNQPAWREALFLAVMLGGASWPIQAAEHEPEATPYRPTVSSPASLSEPGWLEVEFGGQRVQGGSDQRRDSWPVLAKLAMNNDWGVVVISELDVQRTDINGEKFRGTGDTTVLVKHRIPAATGNSAWGVEAGFKSPTANDDIGGGGTDTIINGIYSADLAAYHFDFNLGATYIDTINLGESRTQIGWAAAASRNLDEQWGVFGELSGNFRRGTATSAQLLAGFSYRYSKRVVFDGGIAQGLAAASSDWIAFTGVTVLLGRLW